MSTGTNGMTAADLEAVADKLGAEAGKGKDTRIKFMLGLVSGAYHGAANLEDNKHGANVDDAQYYTERYFKAQQGNVVFDAKAPNQRKEATCFRTCIKGGMWPKGGVGEPIATVNNLMTFWQKARAKPENAKRMQDAANTLLQYLRTQIKRDSLIPDDELNSFCFKKEIVSPTAETIIENMRKTAQQLINGKAAGGTAHDASALIKKVEKALKDRLMEIADERRTLAEELAAAAPELEEANA